MRIGAPMIFGRLWEQTGCAAVIQHLAADRGFGFSLERAVFASVLHRLIVSGSDRACDAWLDAYHVPGADALALHQLDRAMAWLGEALTDQSGATRAPRRTKDLIEEARFERRRNLFSDLSVVLFDTTSLMFTGGGGESLGQFGVSKDHRPELHQVVVSVVLDEAGRPICSDTWPGNATDVKSLLPVVPRLRDRFGIRHMCVVADRGMISTETIAELEARGIDYILGARERSWSETRAVVLTDRAPMVPLTIPRARGCERDIAVKEVIAGDWGPGVKSRRYVICFNPAEAGRDAAARDTIVASLRGKLTGGDKELLGNAGYRRFLATPREGHFEIHAARIADDAQFDRLHVLRTNSRMTMLSVALAYRELWRVEAIFRTAKSILETRPIFHQSDAAIAGHLFCSFLALLLQGARRAADCGRGECRMGRHRPGSGSRRTGDHRAGAEALRAATAGTRRYRRGIQSARRGAAAADPPDPDRAATASQGAALSTTPRSPAVWCHGVLNFPDSSFISSC